MNVEYISVLFTAVVCSHRVCCCLKLIAGEAELEKSCAFGFIIFADIIERKPNDIEVFVVSSC